MKPQNAIQNELNDLGSHLPPDKSQPVFTVPEGYFDNFAASVLATIHSRQAATVTDELAALSPVLAALPRQSPYTVPEHYFADLAANVLVLIGPDPLPAVLETLRQTPYTVPPGYFDGLAAQVAAKLPQPKAKVVSFSGRFMRIAAAAVVVVAAGIFFVVGNRKTIDPARQPQAWVAQKLKNVPKSDMEAFLKTVAAGADNKELARQGGKADVKQLLRDVSTTDLDAFLSELPSDPELSNMN